MYPNDRDEDDAAREGLLDEAVRDGFPGREAPIAADRNQPTLARSATR